LDNIKAYLPFAGKHGIEQADLCPPSVLSDFKSTGCATVISQKKLHCL